MDRLSDEQNLHAWNNAVISSLTSQFPSIVDCRTFGSGLPLAGIGEFLGRHSQDGFLTLYSK